MTGQDERNTPAAPACVRMLIGALGGEGGGLLAQWLVEAANVAGLPVQGTSLPGTSQRTGATTYYVELMTAPASATPVFSLYPAAGGLDLVACSELVETGRMIEAGYVTPDRTHLIGSTHRALAIGERQAMGDGRFDTTRIEAAARDLSHRAVLVDLQSVAGRENARINALLFGLIAGSGVFPVSAEDCTRAIEETGVAVAENKTGFAIGLQLARDEAVAALEPEPDPAARSLPAALTARIAGEFPEPLHPILTEAAGQLCGYQNAGYAGLFLDRLADVVTLDDPHAGCPLTTVTARGLAVWMAYEDVIRVAQIKTSRARFDEVRAEVQAAPGEPVHVFDYLKPGLEELASILPRGLGRAVMRRVENKAPHRRTNIGLHIKTSSVTGFLLMRAAAGLRFWRPRSFRYSHEQAWIECWLAAVRDGARLHPPLGLEIARCTRLVKGYGDTHAHGKGSLTRLFDTIVADALAGRIGPAGSARQIATAREAALADPDGAALDRALTRAATGTQREPISTAAD